MDHFYQNLKDWFNYETLYSEIAKTIPSEGSFAEIGCWQGKSLAYFAVECINLQKKIKLYAVDKWELSGIYTQYFKNCTDPDGLYNKFILNMNPIISNLNILRMSSINAAKQIKDESLDAVFIDASHEYEDVLEDLNAWYPKVKSGGYFCGHDYDPSPGSGAFPGVQKAVHEFFINKKKK
jgi:cephalosporin hydroxylase